MNLIAGTLTIYFLLAVGLSSYSQEVPATDYNKALSFPDKLLGKINNNAVGLNSALDKQTQRYVYSGRLDSLTTSLRFLKDKDIVTKSGSTSDVQQTLESYQQLQGRLDTAERAKKYVQQRQELLKEHLQKLGMTKELQQFKFINSFGYPFINHINL